MCTHFHFWMSPPVLGHTLQFSNFALSYFDLSRGIQVTDPVKQVTYNPLKRHSDSVAVFAKESTAPVT